jgi:polyhydroxyalkanoate synthesis regulator phasin
MANFEDIAKRAFYMGVGFASYAQEKASDTVKDLGVQAQKLAEEMAERGEMSTEEARKFVDDLVEQAQQGTVVGSNNQSTEKEPRRIEIVDEVESTPAPAASSEQPAQSNSNHDDLRQQVQSLQEELRRLKQEK